MYVGIDYGTTNSEIGVYRQGRFEPIPVEGDIYCPSVVCFESPNAYLVGRQAKNRLIIDPEHTIASAKRKMGKLNFKFKLSFNGCSVELLPEEIAAKILEKLINAAAAGERYGDIAHAVISVPAYFNDDARAATKRAGELAGIQVLQLISEPTAAAIAYGLGQGRDQTIAVYDLGGGTFDVSILKVEGNRFEVKAVGGHPRLGGDDFDLRLMEIVTEEFHKKEGIDLNAESPGREVLSAKQVLKEKCEQAKRELSDAQETKIEIPGFFRGRNLVVSVSRDKFEDKIKDLIDKTCDIAEETIRRAGLTRDQINRIILVGGSTNIPLVRQKVKERIRDPYIAQNVLDIVAHGAAIVAAQHLVLTRGDVEGIEEVISEDVRQQLRAMHTVDIYPYRLGISTVGEVPKNEARRFRRVLSSSGTIAQVEGVFSEVVPRNDRLSIERTRAGYTPLNDYQEYVSIEIYRDPGDGDSCEDMQPLGKFLLGKLPRARREDHDIRVTFEIDKNGILTVTAKDFLKGEQVRAESGLIDVSRDISGIAEVEDEEDDDD